MNRISRTISVCLTAALASAAFAAHFTGTYRDPATGITIIIQHNTDTQMQGAMIGPGGAQMQLQGQGDERGAQGILLSPQGQLAFQAQLSPDGGVLQLTLQPASPQGQTVPGGTQQLSLQRVSHEARLPSPQGTGPGSPMTPPPAPGAPGMQPPTPGMPAPQPPGAPPPLPGTTPTTPPQPGGTNPLMPGAPAAGPVGDSWSGVYTGDAGRLTVVVQPATPGTYGGFIEVSGTRYPIQARGNPSYLQGAFQSPSGTFEFALEQAGSVVHLYTGDTQYVLSRQAGSPAPAGAPSGGGNPLGTP